MGLVTVYCDWLKNLEAQVQKLRDEAAVANERADTLEHRMLGLVTRHFAEAWRNRDTEKALDGYLSAGIAELERERDAALAKASELESSLLVRSVEYAYARDAAAKGDAARAQCGGMEMEIQELRNEVATYEEGMRSLACQLGAGGFNAEKLTASELVEKVQWGINNLIETQGRLLRETRAERDHLRATRETASSKAGWPCYTTLRRSD